MYFVGSDYAYDGVNCHCSDSASLLVKTVNQGNVGVYRVIGAVVFVWTGEGDRAMRVWTDGCGTGGRDRSGVYVHGVVRSGDCAFSPRRDTAFQPMRHLLNWQLKHGSWMYQPNSPTVSSRRTPLSWYALGY